LTFYTCFAKQQAKAMLDAVNTAGQGNLLLAQQLKIVKGTLGAMQDQLTELRRQRRAAEDQASIAKRKVELENRAQLLIINVTSPKPSPDTLPIPVNADLFNLGKGPARSTQWEVGVAFSEKEPAKYEAIPVNTGPIELLPGTQQKLEITLYDNELNRLRFKQLSTFGHPTVWMQYTVNYRDAAGGWQTTWVYYWVSPKNHWNPMHSSTTPNQPQ
jgi:hypothetical protein